MGNVKMSMDTIDGISNDIEKCQEILKDYFNGEFCEEEEVVLVPKEDLNELKKFLFSALLIIQNNEQKEMV